MKPTPEEVAALLKALGTTQSGVARFLGVTDRQVRRWAAGEGMPEAVAMLLRMMVDRKISLKTAERYREPLPALPPAEPGE